MFDMGDFLRASGGGSLVLYPGQQNIVKAVQSQGGGMPIDLEALFAKAGGIFQPSSGDMHIDSALTNISLAFMQDQSNFVARRAFRSVPVAQRGNLYWTYPKGAFNRNEMAKRAPGTESKGTNYQVDTARYFCDVYALHVDVADQIRDNADAAFNMDRDVTNLLTMKAYLNEELDWVDKFFGGANFTATPGGTWSFVADGVASSPTAEGSLDFTNASNNNVLQWNDSSSSPITLMRRAKRTMQQETGFRPNVLVMGREVYDELLDHPEIIARIDSGQTPGGPALTSQQSLAAIFELEEILVMEAIVNTAAVGAADVHTFIGGKNALLLYRPSSPGLMTPAAGYTFLWSGFSGANGGGARIKNMRLEWIESDRIEIQSAYETNKVSADLGFYFNGIVA